MNLPEISETKSILKHYSNERQRSENSTDDRRGSGAVRGIQSRAGTEGGSRQGPEGPQGLRSDGGRGDRTGTGFV